MLNCREGIWFIACLHYRTECNWPRKNQFCFASLHSLKEKANENYAYAYINHICMSTLLIKRMLFIHVRWTERQSICRVNFILIKLYLKMYMQNGLKKLDRRMQQFLRIFKFRCFQWNVVKHMTRENNLECFSKFPCKI